MTEIIDLKIEIARNKTLFDIIFIAGTKVDGWWHTTRFQTISQECSLESANAVVKDIENLIAEYVGSNLLVIDSCELCPFSEPSGICTVGNWVKKFGDVVIRPLDYSKCPLRKRKIILEVE